MRAENAVEIITANLAQAFPRASAEALARAAELLILWGAEGAADHLNEELAERMILDLAAVLGVPPESMQRAGERQVQAAQYRTWSRSEYLPPDDHLPSLPRPPDRPRGGPLRG
ncbi:hypothetical protein ABT404_07125 [Streptomyces hyaluromycini]|uniref:Uncharacterized protein n=1 Tax=Streptomyces hyaluromycini TaxID=1377993 RepID=A0ABV1WR02_9ACTN